MHLPAQGHGPARSTAEPHRPLLAVILGGLVIVIGLGSVTGLFLLRPNADDVATAPDPYGGEAVEILDATVTGVDVFDCGDETMIDGFRMTSRDCANVTADSTDGVIEFQLDATRFDAGIEIGDQVRVSRIDVPDEEPTYMFYEFERSSMLIVLTLMFVVLVLIVARWRGLFAILGVGVTVGTLVAFVLPAILGGVNPLAVTVVASAAIMIVVLYLAHGVSIRTTSALLGTLFGLALTAVLGAWATGATHLTGLGGEDDMVLQAIAPEMRLSGVVAASMVVAGLGVLNDVTVTQASAVWELRRVQPAAGRVELFLSAMRIGRDHIASSVYTLVFAYAGSAMTVLLLITAYDRSLIEMATTEGIAQEIVRTLVGAIGLVLAVPGTTALAALLCPKPVMHATPSA